MEPHGGGRGDGRCHHLGEAPSWGQPATQRRNPRLPFASGEEEEEYGEEVSRREEKRREAKAEVEYIFVLRRF